MVAAWLIRAGLGIMLEVNLVERRKAEVQLPRNHLPCTPVNTGKNEGTDAARFTLNIYVVRT